MKLSGIIEDADSLIKFRAPLKRGKDATHPVTTDIIGSAIASQYDRLGFRHSAVQKHGKHGGERAQQFFPFPRHQPGDPVHDGNTAILKPMDKARPADINQDHEDQPKKNQGFKTDQNMRIVQRKYELRNRPQLGAHPGGDFLESRNNER